MPARLKSPPAILVVTPAREEEGERWDDFVRRTPGATHAHHWRWRKILADVFGLECPFLVAKSADGEWAGVLPLARMRSRLTGHALISLPFISDGGPIGSRESTQLLIREALLLAQDTDVDMVEIRARHPLHGAMSEGRPKCTVRLPLPSTSEQLWTGTFRSKLRSQISRPKKEGMEVRFGAEQVEPFYRVFSRNMRDLGTPVLPRLFFEEIQRAFPDEAVFGAVYHRGEPVAAGGGFRFDGEFEMNWASSIREYNPLAPTMLLYWSFMERLIDRDGVRTFDFGRCTPGSTTHRFKLQWGGSEAPLHWLQWPSAAPSEGLATDRLPMQVAAATWRHLPLWLANRIGPVVARRLPWF